MNDWRPATDRPTYQTISTTCTQLSNSTSFAETECYSISPPSIHPSPTTTHQKSPLARISLQRRQLRNTKNSPLCRRSVQRAFNIPNPRCLLLAGWLLWWNSLVRKLKLCDTRHFISHRRTIQKALCIHSKPGLSYSTQNPRSGSRGATDRIVRVNGDVDDDNNNDAADEVQSSCRERIEVNVSRTLCGDGRLVWRARPYQQFILILLSCFL